MQMLFLTSDIQEGNVFSVLKEIRRKIRIFVVVSYV